MTLLDVGSFLRIHNEITLGISGGGPKKPSGFCTPCGKLEVTTVAQHADENEKEREKKKQTVSQKKVTAKALFVIVGWLTREERCFVGRGEGRRGEGGIG